MDLKLTFTYFRAATLFKKKSKLLLSAILGSLQRTMDEKPVTLVQLMSAVKEIERLGFAINPKLYYTLRELPANDFVTVYQFIKTHAIDVFDSNKSFKPMYPNFPQQVVEMSEAEFHFNALMSYWFGVLPETEVKIRRKLTRYSALPALDVAEEK